MTFHIKSQAAKGGKAVARENRIWSRDRALASEMGKRGAAVKKKRREERLRK